MAGTEPLSRATISSVKVFHSPHEGQRPSHLGASNPQFLQKYAFLTFAIACRLIGVRRVFLPDHLRDARIGIELFVLLGQIDAEQRFA